MAGCAMDADVHRQRRRCFGCFHSPAWAWQRPPSNRANKCTLHLRTSTEKLTPGVDVPVRPPRTGANAASDVRGLSLERPHFSELRPESPSARVALATGDYRPNELGASVQDEAAPGEGFSMIPHAAYS